MFGYIYLRRNHILEYAYLIQGDMISYNIHILSYHISLIKSSLRRKNNK